MQNEQALPVGRLTAAVGVLLLGAVYLLPAAEPASRPASTGPATTAASTPASQPVRKLDPERIRELLMDLHATDYRVRAEAVKALGESGDKSVVPDVYQWLYCRPGTLKENESHVFSWQRVAMLRRDLCLSCRRLF